MNGDDRETESCDNSRQNGGRETDREIKKIRNLISDLAVDSSVNKANLEHITEAHKELTTINSSAHNLLFTRTETLNVSLKELETRHMEHIKHGTQDTTASRHRVAVFMSWVAIGVSVATVITVIIVQKVFK